MAKKGEGLEATGRKLASMNMWKTAIAIVTLLTFAGMVGTGCSSSPPGHLTDPPLPEVAGLGKVEELIAAGNYAEAEAQALAVLERVEAENGTESLEVAVTLDVLVEALFRGGETDDEETLDLALRAVAIKEAQLPSGHVGLAPSLLNLGLLLRQLDRFDESLSVLERALALREAALPPNDPQIAASLKSLGNLKQTTGEYVQARGFYERALEIEDAAWGRDDPARAMDLYNLAILLRKMGEYADARPLFDRALSLLQSQPRTDPLKLAFVRNGLAVLLEDTGRYEEALSNYEQALAIAMKLSPDHWFVPDCINNVAHARWQIGDYAGAKEFFERSLAHREDATELRNLAHLSSDMGDYDEADRLFRRALEIRRKALGPDHPEVGSGLVDYAEMLLRSGDAASARERYEQALDILEPRLGEDHSDVAMALAGLARALAADGQDTQARELFEKGLRVATNALGERSPEVAELLGYLADLQLRSGRPGEALEHYQRGLDIQEAIFGPDHIRTASMLNGLGRAQARQGNNEHAFSSALRAASIGREHLRLTARTLPERQALRYASVAASGLDLVLALVSQDPETTRVREAWDVVVRARAAVLDEMMGRLRSTHDADDAETQDLRARLKAAATQLAFLAIRGPDAHAPQPYRSRLDEARREKETLETALARRSLLYRSEMEQRQIGLDEVAQSLLPGSSLVAYRRYTALNGEPEYLAFVLGADSDEPVAIPLGSGQRIESAVVRWRRAVARAAIVDPDRLAEAEADCRVAGDELRRLVWSPAAEQLNDASFVFVVPDGLLHLVNLAALPAAGSNYLIEDGPLFHHLSAERDLVDVGERTASGSGLLALGGVDFDAQSAGPRGAAGDETVAETAATRAALQGCGGFENMQFGPLNATRREVEQIVGLWSRTRSDPRAGQGDNAAEILLGPAATENAFRTRAPGKRVLHLSTHGFFLGEDCDPATPASRGIGGLAGAPAATVSPLLRAGLVLAGANDRGRATSGQHDGILTAEEIAVLDLSGVEWAVLSACDTGVGEIATGEGVLGLRRSFRMAGARTVIMSLWPVDDLSAREWMSALYEGRLSRRLDTAEAVRQASLRLLADRRERGESTHPFFWGAFVAAGDWR